MKHVVIAVLLTMCGCKSREPRTTRISAKQLNVISGEACDVKACTAPLTCLPTSNFSGKKELPTCRLICRDEDDCPEGFQCVKFADGPGAGHRICDQLRGP